MSIHDAGFGDALVVRPRRAADALDIGITRLYELINAGEIESFLDGRIRRITVDSLKSYIQRRVAADQPDMRDRAAAAAMAARMRRRAESEEVSAS